MCSTLRLNPHPQPLSGRGELNKAVAILKSSIPHLRHFTLRLREAGKAKMTVVAAVMHKLLVLVFAILKSGRPYDPNYQFSA